MSVCRVTGSNLAKGLTTISNGDAQIARQHGRGVLRLREAFGSGGLTAGEISVGVLTGLALAPTLSAEVVEGGFPGPF